MRRVHASAIPAQVVNNQPIRNRPHQSFIRDAVRHLAVHDAVNPGGKPPIPVPSDSAYPLPALVCATSVNARPEPAESRIIKNRGHRHQLHQHHAGPHHATTDHRTSIRKQGNQNVLNPPRTFSPSPATCGWTCVRGSPPTLRTCVRVGYRSFQPPGVVAAVCLLWHLAQSPRPWAGLLGSSPSFTSSRLVFG